MVDAGLVLVGLIPEDHSGGVAVRVRWDDYAAVAVDWDEDEDPDLVWVPEDLLIGFVMGGMVPASRLRIGIDIYHRGEVILEYSMTGFTKLVPRLRRACPDDWRIAEN